MASDSLHPIKHKEVRNAHIYTHKHTQWFLVYGQILSFLSLSANLSLCHVLMPSFNIITFDGHYYQKHLIMMQICRLLTFLALFAELLTHWATCGGKYWKYWNPRSMITCRNLKRRHYSSLHWNFACTNSVNQNESLYVTGPLYKTMKCQNIWDIWALCWHFFITDIQFIFDHIVHVLNRAKAVNNGFTIHSKTNFWR